jgi:23S rRNA (cytosine1962-C5)-methyltransferase
MCKELDYQLLDVGNGRKLESFGGVLLDRPCKSALWQTNITIWPKERFIYDHKKGWHQESHSNICEKEWVISCFEKVMMKLRLQNNGQIGIFPEHLHYISTLVNLQPATTLNLFAYTGALSQVLSSNGLSVTHIDSSKKALEWLKVNSILNENSSSNIRVIQDDAFTFLQKEKRRQKKYELVLADPPSFSRDGKGWVIEEILPDLISEMINISSKYVLISTHTPGIDKHILANILKQFNLKIVEHKQLVLKSDSFTLPTGAYALGEI